MYISNLFIFNVIFHGCAIVYSPVFAHLGCFYLLAIIDNVSMNVHVQVFVWAYILFLSGRYLGNVFLGP